MAQQIAITPKTQFLEKYVVPKKTVVITTEDLEFWKTKDVVVTVDPLSIPEGTEVIILSEALQKLGDPVKTLKYSPYASAKIIITVPNEWSWPPEYKPHTNAAHKQKYDTELLARHLEEAGLLYTIRLIEFSGWSFLGAEATRA